MKKIRESYESDMAAMNVSREMEFSSFDSEQLELLNFALQTQPVQF